MKNGYLDRQNGFVTAYDVRKGTKLRVKRRSFDRENGWGNRWTVEMNKTVGKIVEVSSEVYRSSGILMKNGFSYPFFVLEHVAGSRLPASVRVELNDEHTAIVGRNKIVVGCQTFGVGIIKKLQDALDEVTPKEKKKESKHKK